ncbi:hypothetical protein M3Y97_00350900 [Aphelenchoides bicaudatus]|nr:hypothetical protein M3Y97_00350900 [Aphelenchoides bicaudatus]
MTFRLKAGERFFRLHRQVRISPNNLIYAIGGFAGVHLLSLCSFNVTSLLGYLFEFWLFCACLMTPMSRLFRRLSLRKPKTLPASRNVSSPNSCPELHTTCNAKSASEKPPFLPEELIFKCLDNIENPFELARYRRVNHAFRDYVDQRFANIVEMDASRVAFDCLSMSSVSCDSESSCSTSSSIVNDSSSVILNQKLWYTHPAGHKILMRLENNRVELLVDECWTSKEVIMLCGAVSVFRFNLRQITLDAPIIELIIASLSLIDLERWYAYLCYMQAINDNQVHLRFTQSQTSTINEKTKPSFYFPNAERLTIRTTKESSINLARLLDYGVRSQLVMDRQKLDELLIVITDVINDADKTNRILNRNLYHFRCWAGSAGFDERFKQHYSVNVI